MELVTGPFRPALEAEFRDAFARLRREDPLAPIAVIAPSRRLSDRLKELALEALPEGFAAARFFNLFSFARTIYEEAPSSAGEGSATEGKDAGFTVVLDDLVPSGIVRAVLRRHFKNERYLSRAALRPGALLSALHELKAAAVKPEHALSMLAFKDLGLEDAPKLAEILSLYKRYADELRRRRIHVRADVVRVAADHAPKSAWLGSLRHVLYYGFYDLDQNQLDLLREVQRRVPVTLFFPHVEAPPYAYARDFLKTVIAPMAATVREAVGAPPAPRVTRLAASGEHDEVWAAAKEVLRVADRGVPWERIGVVARTLDPYIEAVDTLFRGHGIPYQSSARRRLAGDPQVKAARLLFTLGEFDRADVMDLLRSPFFRRGEGDPETWDRASRLMGIGHGADEWRTRLGEKAREGFAHAEGARDEERRFVLSREEAGRFWGCVKALLEAPPPPSPRLRRASPPARGWRAFADWALERHRRFLEPDPRVEGAIESLAALEGLAAEEPLETLLEALADLSEPAGSDAGVHVLDAMAARGLPFDALVVLGLNERVFPRYILEDAFVRDAVRSRLEHRLGCRMQRKLAGYDEERLLFALLLGSADEVTLVCQRSDDRGRLRVPSVFFGKPAVQVPRRPAARLRAAPFELLTRREAALRTGQGVTAGRAFGWDVTPLSRAEAFLRAVEAPGPLTKHDGLVRSKEYWGAVAGLGLSPTALERLAECPFRYFAAQMLDLEELEEPEEEESLSNLEIGSLYHKALEKHYKHEAGDLEKALAETFASFEEQRSIRYPVLWDVEKERIGETLATFIASEDFSEFQPREFEKALRAELPMDVGGRKTVAFRGFIDRIDVAADGAFRVVDYKKSRGKYGSTMETGIFKKGWLQAPIYLLLAEKALRAPSPEKSTFFYYFIESLVAGEKWALSLDGTFFGRRAEFEARFRGLLEAIPRGEFPIRPGEHCRSCEFGTVCRKSHLPTRLRAEAHEKSREAPAAR